MIEKCFQFKNTRNYIDIDITSSQEVSNLNLKSSHSYVIWLEHNSIFSSSKTK